MELGITKTVDIISDMSRFLGSDNTWMEGATVDVVNVTSDSIYN